MKDEDEQQQKLGTSVIRKSLLTHALLKGAVDDDDGEQSVDERGEEKPMKIKDMDEEDQPEYSMTEIKTVLEEAVEDIEESGIFDDLAENIEEIVRVGSFKERASSMDERREMFSSSMPKTPRGGVNITSSVSMEESNEESEKENIGGGGGGGRSSGSYRRKKAEFLSKEVMESLRERREQNEVAPPVLITEEQLETAFEVINSLETYVEAGEADPDFVEQFVPEELAVIVKGLAETAGFEETLLDDTQQEPVDFEEAVPEELNFEEIRKTFDVQPIASRSMDDVR